MQLAFRLCATFLAIIWLPATVHCSLQQIGLELDVSCCEDDREDMAGPEADCAEGNACTLYENGAFRMFDSGLRLSIPFEFESALLLPVAPGNALTVQRMPAPCADDPGDLRRSWQFSQRAAPPVRAPVLIS